MRVYKIIPVFLLMATVGFAQLKTPVKISVIGEGWANNSINVVSFRKNSLVTHQGMQYTAYYDSAHCVVLGRRKLNSTKWEISRTQYKGDVFDAHNSISIMVDGNGYLHVAWDHHSYGKHLTALNYCQSVAPGSLQLSDKIKMTGIHEDKVTYPEFYKLPDGDLLFFFRDGESGNGNIILNRYALKTKKWTQVQNSFIDGENLRNPYWQIVVDKKGVIHLSWTWRESPDAASNHDICYAKSLDGGLTWTKSNGEKYVLPIKESTAEYVIKIPQNSELINQTSMTIDQDGNPYISTYWKEKSDTAPQYHLLYLKNKHWINLNLGFRKSNFLLSGGGTKGIPISRPQVIAWKKDKQVSVGIVFRDEERGSKASIAVCKNIDKPIWVCKDLHSSSLGSWEPTYDTTLWESKQVLNLLLQQVQQKDNDGRVSVAPQNLSVLQWIPEKN
ncbi:neuraminidase [Pedobacter hiemivivus]|uniref:Neuraminidase n=1 Tax=Pedobacter hiemivivus TaxID=2530454 RepID=A0A4U1GL81_9SPHI|nr:BNR repeat-containing protein [Pedobacter hiemivivus]TKC65145.1 neuraminidase [Pedobacter hiemivivus]